VGAVRFLLDGREFTTFQMLIDPAMPHPKDVQQVQSITPFCGIHAIKSIMIINNS
jgi:hypothetical protein